MQVTPAASFVRHFISKNPPGSLAIVNLQKTASHGKGAIEIHDFCDDFLMRVLVHMNLKPSENDFVRILKLLPTSDGRQGYYQLTFADSTGRLIQACPEFTLRSKSDAGTSKRLSNWPFEVTEDILNEYEVGEFSFYFMPDRVFKFNLQDLVNGLSHRYSFKFEWEVTYFKDETVRNN